MLPPPNGGPPADGETPAGPGGPISLIVGQAGLADQFTAFDDRRSGSPPSIWMLAPNVYGDEGLAVGRGRCWE